jgi:hypothetical protein
MKLRRCPMSENQELQVLHQRMQTLRQYLEEYDRRAQAFPAGSEDRLEAEQAATRTQEELERVAEDYHRLAHDREGPAKVQT